MKINILLLNAFALFSLVMACGWTQALDGRWDGTVSYGALKVPFTIYFEPNGNTLKGSLVNGDTRVSSTEGSFEAGSLRLAFGTSGTRLEATLVNGELKGTIGNGQDLHPFTASQFCSCAIEGEAGPDISGAWEVPDAKLRLTIRRKGEDTLAHLSRPSGEFGPIAGRFDGVTFTLDYFDGIRAAVLEIEQRKDGSLDVKLMEPGAEVKKYRAVQTTPQK